MTHQYTSESTVFFLNQSDSGICSLQEVRGFYEIIRVYVLRVESYSIVLPCIVLIVDANSCQSELRLQQRRTHFLDFGLLLGPWIIEAWQHTKTSLAESLFHLLLLPACLASDGCCHNSPTLLKCTHHRWFLYCAT